MQQFEYKFVRIGQGLFGVKKEAERTYQDVVREQALDGWRLVQVFAPSTGAYGASRFYEVILERPMVEA